MCVLRASIQEGKHEELHDDKTVNTSQADNNKEDGWEEQWGKLEESIQENR